jgi:hypothetical protein
MESKYRTSPHGSFERAFFSSLWFMGIKTPKGLQDL